MIKFVLGMVVGASIGFLVACLVRANEDREMDLIDRQAAIHDLCKTRCGCEPEECCLTFPEDGAEECADVRWLLSLPSAEPEPNWIPVSERLPEEYEYVLLCDREPLPDKNTGYSQMAVGWLEDGQIHCWDDRAARDEFVAWMPLPEPYKGEQDG